MRMEHVKIHEENDNHFVVSHKDGKPFKVPKEGLSDSFLEKIRAHMACGGMVKGYDEGGQVLGETSPLTGLPLNQSPSPTAASTPVLAGLAPNPPPAGMGDVKMADREAGLDTPASQPEQQAAQPAPEPPKKAAEEKLPSGPGMGDLAAGFKEQQAAQLKAAETATEKAKGDYALLQDAQKQRAALSQQWQDRWEANQRQSDAIAEQIANSQIDPDRYWQNHNRTTSTIALILGGIGQGLAGGPNQALEVINKGIERELEAQKANLGKQQSLLSHYVQQGHSLQEARQLAMADLQDVTRGQLQMNATKFAGPEAQNTAALAIGQLKSDSALKRQEAYAKTQEIQGRALDNRIKAMELGMSAQTRPIQMAAETGAVLPEEAGAFLDPKRRVKVPGGWTLANDDSDRKEIEDARVAHSDYEAALHEIEALKDKTAFKGTALDRQGKLALQHFTQASKALQGKSGLGRSQEEEQTEAALGNPTDWFRTAGGTEELIKKARMAGMRHLMAVHQSRLIGGAKAASGIYGMKGENGRE